VAVLVQGFTLVVRLSAIRDRYPHRVLDDGWSAFQEAHEGQSSACDGELVALHFRDRPAFRAELSHLKERGFAEDSAVLIRATELSEQLRTPEAIATLQQQTTEVFDLALVYRKQSRQPHWLGLKVGPGPQGGPSVAGTFLLLGQASTLGVPGDWSEQQAIPEREEPESGDEMLPTWHEFLDRMGPERREYLLSWGPDAYQAYTSAIGGERLFAGPIRPGGLVIEEERVERDADGKERRVLHRWVKFPPDLRQERSGGE
jgi:hypothetical protein